MVFAGAVAQGYREATVRADIVKLDSSVVPCAAGNLSRLFLFASRHREFIFSFAEQLYVRNQSYVRERFEGRDGKGEEA